MDPKFEENLRKEERDRLKAHKDKQEQISEKEKKALREAEIELLRLFEEKK